MFQTRQTDLRLYRVKTIAIKRVYFCLWHTGCGKLIIIIIINSSFIIIINAGTASQLSRSRRPSTSCIYRPSACTAFCPTTTSTFSRRWRCFARCCSGSTLTGRSDCAWHPNCCSAAFDCSTFRRNNLSPKWSRSTGCFRIPTASSSSTKPSGRFRLSTFYHITTDHHCDNPGGSISHYIWTYISYFTVNVHIL